MAKTEDDKYVTRLKKLLSSEVYSFLGKGASDYSLKKGG